ncbi:MAG TPA: cysteine desulfurase family protein [Acidimicrobiales bacterium]|nr:cysteine desulfurase family protein [Acidimicrobiales bacterium]
MTHAYLDHAATTPMRPEAVTAMLPLLTETFGNPSGGHAAARAARHVIEEARDVMAAVLGCAPAEVIFTSGGTEADNLAIAGVADGAGSAVCSAVEHHAVLHAVERVEGVVVGTDALGRVDLDQLAAAVGPGTAVVSLMLVNNETGVVQPLDAAIDVVRANAPDAVLHTDAVAAFSWLDLAVATAGADLVSVSAHKFGGPKGVGALVVREGVALRGQIVGGGQERDRRSGTHNVAGIAAMAAAAEATVRDRTATVARIGALRDLLAERVVSSVPGVVRTAPAAATAAGTCHLRFGGIESEALLVLLDDNGVFASAGSSCASGALEPSHVLRAMGVTPEEAVGALRLSFGWNSTLADVDLAVTAITKAVEQLRAS